MKNSRVSFWSNRGIFGIHAKVSIVSKCDGLGSQGQAFQFCRGWAWAEVVEHPQHTLPLAHYWTVTYLGCPLSKSAAQYLPQMPTVNNDSAVLLVVSLFLKDFYDHSVVGVAMGVGINEVGK